MSKAKLNAAINSVNRRYARGLNDDDQVSRMVELANTTKGYYFSPKYDSYELCTDKERLIELTKKYGYWSKEIESFNYILNNKGGWDYMTDLNSKVKAELKKEMQTT